MKRFAAAAHYKGWGSNTEYGAALVTMILLALTLTTLLLAMLFSSPPRIGR